MATLTMLDPRVSMNSENRPSVPGLVTLASRVIGILDNGQANSTTMLQELAKLLEAQCRAREIVFRTKPTHMQGAPRTMIEELAARCDAVITGLGA